MELDELHNELTKYNIKLISLLNQVEDIDMWLPLSVRKVVPTLTSKSAEIYPSTAGAKQLVTLGFILVPAEAVRPTVMCSRHYIALHCGACRGVLQVKRERRLVL
jgi:hypothetical protein